MEQVDRHAVLSMLQRNADYNDNIGSTLGAGYIGGYPMGGAYRGGAYIGGCHECGAQCQHCASFGGFAGEQTLRKQLLRKYPNDKLKRDMEFEKYLKKHRLVSQYARELKNRTDARKSGVRKPPKQKKVNNYMAFRSDYIKEYKNYYGESPSSEEISNAWEMKKSGPVIQPYVVNEQDPNYYDRCKNLPIERVRELNPNLIIVSPDEYHLEDAPVVEVATAAGARRKRRMTIKKKPTKRKTTKRKPVKRKVKKPNYLVWKSKFVKKFKKQYGSMPDKEELKCNWLQYNKTHKQKLSTRQNKYYKTAGCEYYF